jgi:hypothetical protein
MHSLNRTSFGLEPQGLGADAEERSRFAEIEPLFVTICNTSVYRDLVMGAKRGHALAGPTIAVSGQELVAVKDASDEIVVSDPDELPDRGGDVGRGAIALTTPAPGQAQFGMDAAHPVNDEDNLGRLRVDVSDDFPDAFS